MISPFPQSARVRAGGDFDRIHRTGVRSGGPQFVVLGALAEGRAPRVGCAVSRKVGAAVTRNRIRRLIKEVFRGMRGELPPVDFVVIARPRQGLSRRLTLAEALAALGPLFTKTGQKVLRQRDAAPPRGR